MASGIDKLAQQIAGLLKHDIPSGYDTPATVTRVDGGTVWVHFPGGVDETPVKKTINATTGDTVQVRVSGGKAFLVGNGTAPPTDDKTAKDLHEISNKAINIVRGVADKAYKIAGNTAQYFWITETGTDTGAHITEITKEAFLADPDHGGANLLLRSLGIAVRQGLIELASFSSAGMHVNTYDDQGNEVTIAHLGYGVGTAASGTDTKPYYTLGDRLPNSTIGNWSVAEGHQNTASGFQSHAEGGSTTASGSNSHAEGSVTTASGLMSHAEGNTSTASGSYSHAEGFYTEAYGRSSHAEGEGTQAKGKYAHAEGEDTLVELATEWAHAGGHGTIAAGDAQTAIGKYNKRDTTSLFIVGKGTSDSARANAFDVSSDGSGHFASAIGSGGKTSWNDTNNAGVWLQSTGNIHLSNDSGGSTIGFHYAKSASTTTGISESASGTLTCSGKFIAKSESDVSGNVVVSTATSQHKVSYFYMDDPTTLRVIAQGHSSTFASYDIATTSSDIRIKKNVENCEVDSALNIINQIKLHSFDWIYKPEEHQKIGFIADELEKLDPHFTKGGGYTKEGTMRIKSVDSYYMLGYAVKAIQELSTKVCALEAEVRRLKDGNHTDA